MKSSNHLAQAISLILFASLVFSLNAFANDFETTLTSVQDTDAPVASAASPALSNQNAKSTLKNPNSLLVAMAFNFNLGAGSPQNYKEVHASYCKAAKHGDADAFYALGWMYENGRGVSIDRSIAAQLYAKAAEQGHPSAQASLAAIKDDSAKSALPICLLPDPPKLETAASDAELKPVSDKTAALFQSQRHILKLVNKLAPRYNIDSNLVMAFIAVESGFNVQATSVKNAQGLMQLIPATAQRFGVKDAYKAEDNIKGGLAYLRWLLAYYEGNVELVAAAYNAGEGAVDKYKGVPPYAETRMYVKKIASLYNNATHPYQDNLVKKSSVHNFANKKTM
jgi:soluble lytic murein transglycosylase-like protein